MPKVQDNSSLLSGGTGTKTEPFSIMARVSQCVETSEYLKKRDADGKQGPEPIPPIDSLTAEHCCKVALNMPKGVVKNWSEAEVGAWLKKEKIKADVNKFANEGVDGATLLRISESDLKDIGVTKLSDRKFLMERLKHLAYLELYPELKEDDESTNEGDGSKRTVSRLPSNDPTKKNEPASSELHLAITKKATYLYGGASIGWELIMNLAVLNPMLHCISLFPAAMTGLETASWWYRACVMCAVKGRRNKIQALSDMVMKDSSEWEEEANDLEDKIYLYTTFKAYFLMLSIVWFVLIAILVGIVAGVTAPPSEVGTDEVCGPKPHCNGQGTCDAAGECWCVVGMFTDSSKCENVAGTGIVAIIFLVFFLLGFMKFYGRFRFFSKELVVLKKTLEERMVDLEKMIAAEQGEA